MDYLQRWYQFMEQSQASLEAAERVRKDSSETDPMVEYHLRRAEVFARLAQSVPEERRP